MKNPNNFEVDSVERDKSVAFIEALDILARSSNLDESIREVNRGLRKANKDTTSYAKKLQKFEALKAKKESLVEDIKEPLKRAIGGKALLYAGYQPDDELTEDEYLDFLAHGVFRRYYGAGTGMIKKHQLIKDTLISVKIL